MAAREFAVVASFAWGIAGIAIAAMRAWRRGTTPVVAAPVGSAWRGVTYAFGPGMSPRAKESASQHPFMYATGVAYHVGVVAALTTLGATLAAIAVPRGISVALALLLLLAVGAGAGLLTRRLTTPVLRAISAPDDYAANLLVDAWLLTAAFVWLLPGTTTSFLIISCLLGLYAPLGKIRHCVFFFLARARYGARLGRRGLVGARVREVRP